MTLVVHFELLLIRKEKSPLIYVKYLMNDQKFGLTLKENSKHKTVEI